MPKIDVLRVRIQTGDTGSDRPASIRFNGFELPLVTKLGGLGPGESYEGDFALRSMGHSCVLLGPKTGPWDIRSLRVVFDYGHGQPKEEKDFGARVLKPGEEWDLLADPARTFDV